jgi:pimeloyl-ACP methyl ester carboxylesterase
MLMQLQSLVLFSVLMCYGWSLAAQQAPYDVFPEAKPPYYRVRFEPSTEAGKLMFGVNYTIWIPPGVAKVRGVVVHQHGCGEGSCKSGLTGAYDLHWQALALKHSCALLSPAYEQPEKADCQMWCDPRNGSGEAFQNALQDLGKLSGHPELAEVPWALWGHSGGGHWCGGMVLMYPERVAAAWLRSGVPLLKADEKRAGIRAHVLREEALQVPIMCNLGTKEGVTDTTGRFAGVWPANKALFNALRSQGGLVSVAIDPLTSHECGNQRYLAIPWLDACLTARLSPDGAHTLQPINITSAWYSELTGVKAESGEMFSGDKLQASWHIDERMAKLWEQFVKDAQVVDTTAPPKVRKIEVEGKEIRWEAEGDLESGIAAFEIYRDGTLIATLGNGSKNPFGRAVFQGLQYSDTPQQPLIEMVYLDEQALGSQALGSVPVNRYKVVAINTVGLKSE